MAPTDQQDPVMVREAMIVAAIRGWLREYDAADPMARGDLVADVCGDYVDDVRTLLGEIDRLLDAIREARRRGSELREQVTRMRDDQRKWARTTEWEERYRHQKVADALDEVLALLPTTDSPEAVHVG